MSIQYSVISSQIYILGPCSAETREQVMETAKAISDLRFKIDFKFIFRAGVWKPRTRPETFQGVGEPALAWLQEVKRTYGVPVATEVATPEHVEAALKAGIDYLWIGARTSANPLAVQEIANAIDRFAVRPAAPVGPLRCKTGGKSPVGILIKNPVNQDAELWLGNIARLEKTGVPVMAIHRGCGHKPCWSMAHKVRLARPDIPMLLDPSHMSGDAAQVPVLMGKVAELGLDGAMIEVHAHPEQALSDKAQQIRPEELGTLGILGALGSIEDKELNWLRAEIDELDERLWDTIAARMDVSKRIGEWKKEHGVTPLQPERYQEIVERINELTNERGLSTDFALRIWEQIHEESLRQQK